jgi:sortase A
MGNVGLGGGMQMPSPHVALDHPYRARTSPPERLVIPSISLDTRVVGIGVQSDRLGNLVWETAAFAVGHHQGSANPGQIGNVVLSGHISSPNEGAVFRRLPQLKIDDGFAIITAQQSFLYRVRDVRVVTPSAVEVLDATDRAVATLITCVPDGVYSHRLVIRADAV